MQQLESVLKSMEEDIGEKEMTLVILNGLPSLYKNLISNLDAVEDDEDSFLLKLVKCEPLLKKQRK